MTPEEVREKLGMKTWGERRLDVYLYSLPDRVKALGAEKTAKELDRQTGRTTKMICEALAAMSEGKTIRFVGHNKDSTDYIVERAKKYAKTLGITTELIVQKNAWPPPQLFVDHVARGEL